MEIKRGVKVKKYQAFTCQMLGINNSEEKEKLLINASHI